MSLLLMNPYDVREYQLTIDMRQHFITFYIYDIWMG